MFSQFFLTLPSPILNVEPISQFFLFHIMWVFAGLLTFKLSMGWVCLANNHMRRCTRCTTSHKTGFFSTSKERAWLAECTWMSRTSQNFIMIKYQYAMDWIKAGRKSCSRITFTLGLPWLPCLSLMPRSQIHLFPLPGCLSCPELLASPWDSDFDSKAHPPLSFIPQQHI